MSSPSGVRGGAPPPTHFFGIFEVHRTLLMERTVPTKPAFSVKKSTQSTIGAPTPSEYAPSIIIRHSATVVFVASKWACNVFSINLQ